MEAKAGKGSATLSMAYSGARFGSKARGRVERGEGGNIRVTWTKKYVDSSLFRPLLYLCFGPGRG